MALGRLISLGHLSSQQKTYHIIFIKWTMNEKYMSYWNMVMFIDFPYLLDGIVCILLLKKSQQLFIVGTLPLWDSKEELHGVPLKDGLKLNLGEGRFAEKIS